MGSWIPEMPEGPDPRSSADRERAKRRREALRGHLTYLVAAATILVMGVSLYVASQRLQETVSNLHHEMAEIEHMARLSAEINRADATQRGFLLYGDAAFLERRDGAIDRVRTELETLRSLMSDDAAQLDRLAGLRALLEARIAGMIDIEAQRRAGIAVADQEPELIGRINAAYTDIRAAQTVELDMRRAAEKSASERTLLLIGAAFGVVLLVLLPAYAAFVKESRARRRAQGFVESLADAVPGALVRYRLYTDGRSRYEFVSEGAMRLRGFSREDALQDPETVMGTIHEDDRKAFGASLARAARDLTQVEFDYRVRGPNGETRWIRTTAAPRRARDGSAVFSAYWSDVTQQKRQESDLREAKEAADAANRAKSAFLATMSHEIRTPMNGVLGMLELLALTELNREQRGTLAIVRESGRSLMRIIDDILDLSKIEAGKLELRPEPANVAELVERVRNVYSGNASSKGLVLRHHVDGRISPALVLDPQRLLQILNNLVSNAIKFTEKGEVTILAGLVSREPNFESVRFTVCDTGPGISPGDRERLFAPFSQVSENPQASSGTGLGLSICRRLAGLMGGTIEIEGGSGRGTTMSFTLRLPVAAAPPAGAESQGERPERADPTRGRRRAPTVQAAVEEGSLVLVVDDHPINRMVLLRQIQALGYAAEAAEDGIEALDLWGSGRFGAIFTDCHMPELDGYQLTRHIRKVEQSNDHVRTPIIACTANVLGGEAERCLDAGMDDYLPKPVVLQQLARKLDQWLPLAGVQAAAATVDVPVQRARVPILDLERLALVIGPDTDGQLEALGKYKAFNAEDVRGLEQALAASDLEEATHFAHRIKGAARTFGAEAIGAMAEELEMAGRSGNLEAIRTAMPRLAGAFEDLDREIDAKLGARAIPAGLPMAQEAGR